MHGESGSLCMLVNGQARQIKGFRKQTSGGNLTGLKPDGVLLSWCQVLLVTPEHVGESWC